MPNGWARVLDTAPEATLAAGGALTTLDGVEAEEGVPLRPFGIEVMKITGSGATDAGLEPA
jgi:hypothetical protein